MSTRHRLLIAGVPWELAVQAVCCERVSAPISQKIRENTGKFGKINIPSEIPF